MAQIFNILNGPHNKEARIFKTKENKTYPIGYTHTVGISKVAKAFSPWTIVSEFTHVILMGVVTAAVRAI